MPSHPSRGRASPGRSSLHDRTTRRDLRRRPPPRLSRLGTLWRWVKRITLGALALVAMLLLGLGGVLWYYGRDLPDVGTLRSYQPPQVTRVLDRRGRVLGEAFEERRTVVPIERVPRVLVLSVLAAEDADFFRHRGLDYPGLVRALGRGILNGGRVRGTSTITQQVIKNLLLSPERTVGRKVRELLLARRVEQELGKREILALYLNHVNFGHGRYGVQEASRYYFGVDVEDLTLAQASLIAGIPQSPTYLSPRTHPDAARRRQLFVLGQLEDKRAEYWPDLALEEIREAREAAPELIDVPERDYPAAEVVAHARRLLSAQVGEEAARRGGYEIRTTIDARLQRAARRALREGLSAVDGRQHLRGPLRVAERRPPLPPVETLRVGATHDAEVAGVDPEHGLILLDVGGHRATARLEEAARFNPEGLGPTAFAPEGARVRVSIQQLPPEDDPEALPRARLELGPEGAVVVIDARSREVLALVGGYDEGPGFDRATSAVRQPGSTFKPFVMAAAIRSRRYTPATIVLDAPGVYDDWRPSNYEAWSFEGGMRLREALARSVNQVAVRVIEEVGPPEVARLAAEMGIGTDLDPSLSLALGASDVRPAELVNAYATLAAGGRYAPYRLVTAIVGPDGRQLELPPREPPRDVLTSAESYVVTDMLTSVIREGTGRRARRLQRPVAGKTGTSNDVRDAWFVGYTAERVAGVWVGYDDRRTLGRRESGSRTALPIWVEVMAAGTRGRPATPFPRPSGVVSVTVDAESGLLPYEGQTEGLVEEVFLEGTAPTERAPDPGLHDESSLTMAEFDELDALADALADDGAEEGSEAAPP